ncbi:hypothetical protein N7486_005131 [Penicillium sp. IBT 16267x]|nr:hypothetical protein N7486_005131 [Penicillium sp. IBT 16267x]
MKPLGLVALLYLIAPSNCWPKIKDEVSLQWAICDTNPHTVLTKLNAVGRNPEKLDPITYYDTAIPVYTQQGLMFRTKIRGGRQISVVKVRLPTPESNVRHYAKACRWDRYGNETTFVCKRQAFLNTNHIWSTKQKQLAEEFQSNIAWENLVGYGPYLNPKWKTLRIDGYRAVFDDVAVQSLHLMELEVKVHRTEEDRVYQAITEYLITRGVVLCARQESKTMRLFRTIGGAVTQDESRDVYTHDL